MKKQLILYLFLVNFSFSFSQNNPWCGVDNIYKKLLNEHPIYKTKTHKYEKYWQNYSKAQKKIASDTTILIVPVVVHIIHNNGPENIPDSVVYEQIDVLNEDFRKIIGTNGDGSGVDVGIKF